MRETVLLGVRIDKSVNDKLREVLPAGYGVLGKFVEEAIKEKLERDYGIKL